MIVRTPDGYAVDFLATPLTGPPILIQVCVDISDPATRKREFRALENARAAHPHLAALLLTLGSTGIHLAHAEAPLESRCVLLGNGCSRPEGRPSRSLEHSVLPRIERLYLRRKVSGIPRHHNKLSYQCSRCDQTIHHIHIEAFRLVPGV